MSARTLSGFVLVLVILAGAAFAEEERGEERYDLLMELYTAEAAAPGYGISIISLMIAQQRLHPDLFTAEMLTALNDCGKLAIRAGKADIEARTLLKTFSNPETDKEKLARFHALTKKVSDCGRELNRKLDALVTDFVANQWKQWNDEVDKEDEAEKNKSEPPKDEQKNEQK